jgi:hypothetical protein
MVPVTSPPPPPFIIRGTKASVTSILAARCFYPPRRKERRIKGRSFIIGHKVGVFTGERGAIASSGRSNSTRSRPETVK